MSDFVDGFRSLASELFLALAAPATLTRAGTKTMDPITAVVTATGDTSISIRAALGKRRVKADDGTSRIESTAKLNASAKAGDKLVISTLAPFTITDVEEANPDGLGGLVWTVTLK